MPDESEEDDAGKQKWAGFSDYENVAARLHNDINKAVDAYAHLDSRSSQHIGLTPQSAVNTRAAILRITKRLAREVDKMDHTEPFEEMNERWSGDDGYVAKLERTDFYNDGIPPWLSELVDDIVEAGWELGYLKAGIEKPADPTDDDAQVKEMID